MQQKANDGAKAPDRDKLVNRLGALRSERASYWGHWQDLSRYILPRSGRFFTQDRNKGEKRHNSIYDNTGTRALKVLGAGMMAGATSPARPWFRLSVADSDLAKNYAVKVWLEEVTELMRRVFQKSNTYRSMHTMYEELGCFGTAASIVLPDYNNIIHHYPLTCGEYAIAADYQGNINTLYREFERPVSAVVKEFGYENCSQTVKNLYDRGNLDAWIPLVHAIEPREDRDFKSKSNKHMPFGSYYFELGGEKGKCLRESGFKDFPAVVPRWATAGGDIYGGSPGMEALGDIQQLQHQQLRKGQGIDYKTMPPLQVPTSLKNREIDTLPGGVTYFDPASPQAGIKSLFEVNLDLSHLLQDIQDCRERIRGAFYADLFLMLANATDTRMTATEVAERHEEKLLMLGPVLERLHNELLDPLISSTFVRMLEAGMLPTPPEELANTELSVEFVSMLAQAQRAVGANTVDRFISNIGAVAQFKPGVLDKVDEDYWAESYADMLGVDPRMIVATEKVALIRNQRAEAQQQQAQQEQALQQSQTAKNLAQSPTSEDNALGGVMQMFSGYNT